VISRDSAERPNKVMIRRQELAAAVGAATAGAPGALVARTD